MTGEAMKQAVDEIGREVTKFAEEMEGRVKKLCDEFSHTDEAKQIGASDSEEFYQRVMGEMAGSSTSGTGVVAFYACPVFNTTRVVKVPPKAPQQNPGGMSDLGTGQRTWNCSVMFCRDKPVVA